MSQWRFPLILATTNTGKQEEWLRIFSRRPGAPVLRFPGKKEDIDEIQHLNPLVVVKKKAIAAAEAYREPILIEDVSFGLYDNKGWPGIAYAIAEEAIGLKGILAIAALGPTRRATVTQTIAFVLPEDPAQVCIVEAKVHGTIPEKPRGTNGFGFDSIFIPDGSHLTYAEMSPAAKDECSMRRIAIEQLLCQEWQTFPV